MKGLFEIKQKAYENLAQCMEDKDGKGAMYWASVIDGLRWENDDDANITISMHAYELVTPTQLREVVAFMRRLRTLLNNGFRLQKPREIPDPDAPKGSGKTKINGYHTERFPDIPNVSFLEKWARQVEQQMLKTLEDSQVANIKELIEQAAADSSDVSSFKSNLLHLIDDR